MNARQNAQRQIEMKETRVAYYDLLREIPLMKDLIDITEERHHLMQEMMNR